MKNTYTGKQYPRTCLLIRHADVVQLLCSQDRIAGINKELARLQAERLKPVAQPMSYQELMRDGLRRFMGIDLSNCKKADEVTKC